MFGKPRKFSAEDGQAIVDYFKAKRPSKYRNVKTVVDGKRQQPERTEQRAIVQLLRSIGASVYVLGTTRRKGDHPGTMQTPGIPDLYVFLPKTPTRYIGMAVWIEVKAKRGRPSAAQNEFRRECKALGVSHVLGGVDDVIMFLEDHRYLKATTR